MSFQAIGRMRGVRALSNSAKRSPVAVTLLVRLERCIATGAGSHVTSRTGPQLAARDMAARASYAHPHAMERARETRARFKPMKTTSHEDPAWLDVGGAPDASSGQDTDDEWEMPSRKDPRTEVLNRMLRVALHDADAKAGLAHVVNMLNVTQAPFNGITVVLALKLAARMAHLDAHARLFLAVRVIRRSRKHKAWLSSLVTQLMLDLAKPLRKVNVIMAVHRMVQKQHVPPLQVWMRRVDVHTYCVLVSYLVQCNRQDLKDKTIVEMIKVHDAKAEQVFERLVRHLISQSQNHVAVDVWENISSSALAEDTLVTANILRSGAMVCSITKNATEARSILRKYRQLKMTPDARTLHFILATFINAECFDRARKVMRGISRLCFVLRADALRQYIRNSFLASTKGESLHQLLLPLAEILVDAPYLCASEGQRLSVLRTYFGALQTAVADSRLSAHARATAESADRVFQRWQIPDATVSSHMVFLASRGGLLNLALKAARAHHDSPGENIDEDASGPLLASAYEALAEQSVAENRLRDALQLVFKTDSSEPLTLRRRSNVPGNDAAHIIQCYVRAFGRLGRLDLCREVFESFLRAYDPSVVVSNAYMKVLSESASSEETVALFRRLQEIHSGSSSSMLNAFTYSLLGTTVLKSLSSGRQGQEYGTALSTDAVFQLVDCIESFLAHEGVNQSEVLAEKELAVQQAEAELCALSTGKDSSIAISAAAQSLKESRSAYRQSKDAVRVLQQLEGKVAEMKEHLASIR
ncbi:hypothetical protein FVE85_9395 [Porphyridium purpureum]|uniref:Pentatricopeptide repeat-containing protein n=1 Tax=Porphyridium purpureum TaxID=35688 RepID=A0A5J4YHZ6_PORPP|nr:hypothetical protein FVE85_9395 [Porphyridium purpureum]|eukprot:POR9595..scf255_21